MEKKRIGLIFSGLCLALALSVSSVEGQCAPCEKCDRDGDGLIKDTKPCIKLCGGPPDLDDRDAAFCDGSDDGSKATSVFVTFDDALGDSIQSDGGGSYVDGEGVLAIIPDQFHPPGQLLIYLTGDDGGRNLLINFGDRIPCDNPDDSPDCVLDDRPVLVECPFKTPPGVTPTQLCSALVKATLHE